MTDLRFDGQVAIVTGAGGRHNLGRAFSRLLAAHGAKVVVNDVIKEGAERVAQEIRDAGGEAIADSHDIGKEANAQAIVKAAIDKWGRLDILVNNGGVILTKHFDEQSPAEVDAQIDSHFKGATWMSYAAWPHFKKQRRGRIVNIISTAAGRQRVMYYAVKGGMNYLTYALAMAGSDFGIKVNAVIPLAGTDATVKNTPEGAGRDFLMTMSPDLIAPIVGVLAHESCPVNGEEFLAMNGLVQRYIYVKPREGDASPGLPGLGGPGGGYTNANLTMGDVVDHWNEIVGPDFRPLAFPPEPDFAPPAS